jgi:hypothetical protein
MQCLPRLSGRSCRIWCALLAPTPPRARCCLDVILARQLLVYADPLGRQFVTLKHEVHLQRAPLFARKRLIDGTNLGQVERAVGLLSKRHLGAVCEFLASAVSAPESVLRLAPVPHRAGGGAELRDIACAAAALVDRFRWSNPVSPAARVLHHPCFLKPSHPQRINRSLLLGRAHDCAEWDWVIHSRLRDAVRTVPAGLRWAPLGPLLISPAHPRRSLSRSTAIQSMRKVARP